MAIKPLKNEQVLLPKVAAGDQRAFTELFEGYYQALGEFVYKTTKDLDTTEEIIQDVFVKIWHKRETLPQLDSFVNYLFILSRNQTYTALRKRASERSIRQQLEDALPEELQVDQLEDQADHYRALIEQAVSKLPVQQQKAYRLSRYERLKHDEIAEQLQLSPETVKKHIQYALSAIRKELGQHTDPMILLILLSSFILT